MSHTYALLEVSKDAYDEIRDKLFRAGYHHAFAPDGDEIDMHGIALIALAENSTSADEPKTGAAVANEPVRAAGLHCATCQCNKLHPTPPVPSNPMSRSWHDDSATLAAAAQRYAEGRAEADAVLKDVFTERPKS